MSIISVQAADITSPYFGGSEQLLRHIFASARLASPCVIVIDDVDTVFAQRNLTSLTARPHGGSGASSVSERLLSTLLNELDGIGARGGTTEGR